MNLLEDALMQYEELEASFFQSLRGGSQFRFRSSPPLSRSYFNSRCTSIFHRSLTENNFAWFGKMGGQSPGDDSAPLLSTTKKPYREMIMANTISVFDFRCYLFARQCALLGRMGKIAEVARRGGFFVSSFARTLRECDVSFSFAHRGLPRF